MASFTPFNSNRTLNSIDSTTKKIVRVAAGIIIKDNTFLIAQRNNKRHLAGFWEFPGGKIEDNESAVQACQRELKEELHCMVAIDSYFLTCKYEYEDFILNMDMYLCHLPPHEKIQCVEHAELKFINADEIDSYNFAPADLQFLPNIKQLMLALQRHKLYA